MIIQILPNSSQHQQLTKDSLLLKKLQSKLIQYTKVYKQHYGLYCGMIEFGNKVRDWEVECPDLANLDSQSVDTVMTDVKLAYPFVSVHDVQDIPCNPIGFYPIDISVNQVEFNEDTIKIGKYGIVKLAEKLSDIKTNLKTITVFYKNEKWFVKLILNDFSNVSFLNDNTESNS